ncbi:MAG TPA: BTAD domain-containing putative transcriptional regulator [Chloroflexia bacterium]|nr:BTAD domain-containing putative transcriptional regulator [Chloroflexia bacterium]
MLNIQLMGDFRVRVGEVVIPDEQWQLRKAAAIVKLLALAKNHCLLKEYLVETLWPGVSPAAAASNFRYALHKARKALIAVSPDHHQYLRSDQDRLFLAVEGPVRVDVEVFEAALAAAQVSADPQSYRVALTLYTGPLLPQDLYEDWTEPHRAQLRQAFTNASLELSKLYEKRSEFQLAITALERLAAEEPLQEEITFRLMRLYAAIGQPGFAIEKYQKLAEALREELDLEPSESLNKLYLQIRDTAAVLPLISNKAKTSFLVKGNLPAPLTSFIGREVETAEVSRLLSEHRLVTITGMGGSGKTSLALAVAREVASNYPGGAWLVELASLADPGLVAQRVVTSLGLKLSSDSRADDTLAEALNSSQLLVVLDNCEHLLEECARLADFLLKNCPGLRMLATSREGLGVAGEQNYSLPLLPIPLAGETNDLERVRGFASIRLFVERARERKLFFELNRETVRSVVRICQKLEGIPLAIELAAARVGILSIEQIAAFMDESLHLLKTYRKEVPDRQATLRGAIDWSYHQLKEEEQAVFRALAVFSGGACLEGVSTLYGPKSRHKLEIIDILSRLAQKSLILVDTEAREARYRQLEVIRQYGRELLVTCGELEFLQELHASYYLKLVEQAEAELTGAHQSEWLAKLETEIDNLRTALEWGVENRPEVALRIGAALRRFWWAQGYISEGVAWLERGLAAASLKATSPRSRAAALVTAGALLSKKSSYPRAITMLEEALAIFRDQGDDDGAAVALGNLGMALGRQSKLDEAREVMQECLALDRRRSDHWGVAYDLSTLGDLAYYKRNPGEAQDYYREAGELYRELGDRQSYLLCQANLAEVARLLGDFEHALKQHASVLEALQESENNIIIPGLLQPVAHLYLDMGNPDHSVLLLSSSETLREQGGISLDVDARVEFDEIKKLARLRLEPEVFRKHWEQGQAMSGGQVVDYTLALINQTLSTTSTSPRLEKLDSYELSLREKQVAELVAQGLSNREIAMRLGLSKRTVDNHLHKLLWKLGARSRNEIREVINLAEQ